MNLGIFILGDAQNKRVQGCEWVKNLIDLHLCTLLIIKLALLI